MKKDSVVKSLIKLCQLTDIESYFYDIQISGLGVSVGSDGTILFGHCARPHILDLIITSARLLCNHFGTTKKHTITKFG